MLSRHRVKIPELTSIRTTIGGEAHAKAERERERMSEIHIETLGEYNV